MDDAWSRLSDRTRERIGRPLPDRPDAADPYFLQLLGELRHVDALLAEQVIDAFTGTDHRLSSEQEAETDRRRQRVRASLFGRFFRPDGLRTGRVRLNVRKVVHWAGAVLAIVLLIWSAAPKSSKGSHPPAPAQVSVTRAASDTGATLSPVRDRAGGSGPSLWPPPQPPTPPPPPVPVPLPLRPPDDLLPSTRQGLTRAALWQGPPEGDGLTTKVIVYQTDTVAREASPVVYERTLPGQPVGILAQAEQVSGGAARTAAVVSRPGPLSGTTADSPELRGQLLEAALVTAVTVSSVNERTPVLAEVTQGPLQGAVLVGQAVVTRDGLVGIQFTTIIKDEQERRFTGIAYDAVAGRPGIEGHVSTMMPGAVTALTAATLQAAGDYFRARAQQQVSVTNGVLAVTPATPTFWDSLAATVAKAFAPAAPSTVGPTVVTRLERGTTFTVVVM